MSQIKVIIQRKQFDDKQEDRRNMSYASGFVKQAQHCQVDQPFEAFGRQGKVASLDRAKSPTGKILEDIVDLNGKYVLPGFIDSHLHIGSLECT